ncbi:hypothetical protein [Anatilimnocola floriformis]|uniref:hypothetical protein n=1 Tax=Anatilimnocola floriformis TaxID=2948575 RepID=UPI0020C2E32F|nr:hypothetical protein [Anatilimnocola floriformis]
MIDTDVNESLTLADVVDAWRYESRVSALVTWPEVREAVALAERQATKPVSAEKILSIADKLLPQVVSMEGVAQLAQLIWTRAGVKTDRRREGFVAAPIGETILRTICSLARRSQVVQGVSQASDGCVLEATQPSDMWSLAGTLVITIRQHTANISEVTAVATVTGQMFDWGKNGRCLQALFDDLTAVSPQSRAA